MSKRMFIAIAFVLSAAPHLLADPIDFHVNRSAFGFVSFLDVSGVPTSEIDGTTSTTAGTFATSHVVTAQTDLALLSVTAAQNTQLDLVNHRLSGSGSISADNTLTNIAELDMNEAVSDVAVQITLARATPFRFTGVLTAANGALVQAAIEGLFNEATESGTVNVNRSGVLQPGSHLFFTRATLGESIPSLTGQAAFDIDFTLGRATTPEPTSLALLAAGIIAAGIERRRRATTRE